MIPCDYRRCCGDCRRCCGSGEEEEIGFDIFKILIITEEL